MNARRQIIHHNNKTVIFLDHANLSGAAYVQAIEASMGIAGRSTMEDRLILIDTTNSVVDKAVLKALKALSSMASSHVSKIALLGLSGIQVMFMRTIATFSKVNIKPFSNRKKALDWLTSD
jgi:ABC-type uncharacterized transport system permease subunit